MSIDLDILSTVEEPCRWADVKSAWRKYLGDSARDLLGDAPDLRRLGVKTSVGENERFSFRESYYIELPVQNTLLLIAMPNEGNLDELDYLDDYGRNLSRAEVRSLAAHWRAAGHYYEVTSMMGRGQWELAMLAALASAIAETCRGYVILMNNDIFDLGVGVYTPEEFHRVRPRFGRSLPSSRPSEDDDSEAGND